MTSDLRIGLVGAGMVAEHHVKAWQACEGARLVAIADPNKQRAGTRAKQAGKLPTFTDLQDMVSHLDLDAVDIVAPVGLHAALIKQAADLGMHVLCQKPLVASAHEGNALLAALPNTPSSPRVMVHENWRWRSPYQALKALHLEDIKSFEMRVESAGLLEDASGNYPALERQPFFADLNRFLVFEVLIHHLDTLAFLFGPLSIKSAELSRRCPDIQGEDYARIDLMAGGVKGTLTGDFCVEGARPLPTDILRVSGRIDVLIDGWSLTVGGQPTQQWAAETAYQDGYTATIQHFVDALGSGKPFATSAATGVELLRIVERIYSLADWQPQSDVR